MSACRTAPGLPARAAADRHLGRTDGHRNTADRAAPQAARLERATFRTSRLLNSIVGTLRRSTRRYQFHHGHAANVIDLGLRLEDVDGLETEDVHIESPEKAYWNLHENGASPEEIDFLLERRVELNALASDALVAWIEDKLQQHGVVKIVPDGQTLADAYARMRKQALVQDRIKEVLAEVAGSAASVPDDLAAQVTRRLKKNRQLPWDAVVRAIAEADHRRSAP